MSETIEPQKEKTEIYKPLSRSEHIICWCSLGLALAFVLGTLIYVLVTAQYHCIFTCIFGGSLLFTPFFARKIFHLQVNTLLYVFVMFYAITPIFGYVFKFYYNVFWWDSFMHTAGGVVFAILGVFFAKWFNKNGNMNLLTRAIFALCFSITVAVAWEFVEYTSDMLFRTDMQKDTYIDAIDSYLLGLNPDEIGRLVDIETVVVNGQPLKGYIDIGLIDTMSDLIVETFGALVFVTWFAIDKDKHPLLVALPRTETKKE